MAEYTVPGYPQILKCGMTTTKVKKTATRWRKTYRKKEEEREEKGQYEWKLRKNKSSTQPLMSVLQCFKMVKQTHFTNETYSHDVAICFSV